MCPINDSNSPNRRGRPALGAESRSVERKIRLEPYLDENLAYVCRIFGISKSEAIRQGVILYLKEASRIIKGG